MIKGKVVITWDGSCPYPGWYITLHCINLFIFYIDIAHLTTGGQQFVGRLCENYIHFIIQNIWFSPLPLHYPLYYKKLTIWTSTSTFNKVFTPSLILCSEFYCIWWKIVIYIYICFLKPCSKDNQSSCPAPPLGQVRSYGSRLVPCSAAQRNWHRLVCPAWLSLQWPTIIKYPSQALLAWQGLNKARG